MQGARESVEGVRAIQVAGFTPCVGAGKPQFYFILLVVLPVACELINPTVCQDRLPWNSRTFSEEELKERGTFRTDRRRDESRRAAFERLLRPTAGHRSGLP